MARLLAAVIILFPLSFVRVDQRGTAFSPMVIQLESNSPAFAAFEDLQNNYEEPIQEVDVDQQVIHLAAGTVYRHSFPEVQTVTTIALKAMKISSEMETTAPLQTEMARYQAPEVEPQNSSFNWDATDAGKSLSERKQEILAGLSKEDLALPSPREKARQLVKEELADYRPDVREHSTLAGGTIIVKKPGASAGGRSPYINREIARHDDDHRIAKDDSGKILVRGSVMITGGIPDMGADSKWRLFRQADGRVRESGSVNATEAEFSIHVGEIKGLLIAELSDRYGQVYGRGQAALTEGDVALNVQPVESAVIASHSPDFEKSYSYSSSSSSSALLRTTVPAASAVDVSQYSNQSRFFMEASAPGHFSSVALGFLNQLKQIPIYTTQAMKAFSSISQSFYKPLDVNRFATVWGKVLKEGQEISGAIVELASLEGRTIYFNEIGIPRGELQRTTSSGQFAAVNLAPGVQSVRVSYNGRSYPAQVVPTFEGKITHLNLEIPTRFFDHLIQAFSLLHPEELIATTLRVVGMEDLFDLGDGKPISLPFLESGVLVEWDSGPSFEIMRAHLPPLYSTAEIGLPAVSSEWIEGLIAQSGKVLDRRLGWAMGFTDDAAAEVRLQNEQAGLHTVVYFDRDLKFWRGDSAPAGGGFVAINLPLGYQTLDVRPLHAAQSRVESFVSEPYFLHLIGSERFIQIAR